MKILVHTVEGKTTKKGSKQGRTYEIVEESSIEGFFSAISDTGKRMTVWNVNGDWSKIGISRENVRRYSYSTDFEIIQQPINMKIKANQVTPGMEIAFGWGQWLKVQRIEESFQKNGIRKLTFHGPSVQETTRSRTRKYPIIRPKLEDSYTCKELTLVTTR